MSATGWRRFAKSLRRLAAAPGLNLKARFAWLDQADDAELRAMALETAGRRHTNHHSLT